jgi:ParB-like chromosome segregation protein Spo0J
MPDEEAKQRLLKDVETVWKHIKAENRRHREALKPLTEELDPLTKRLAEFDVSPRELARAMGLNPKRAKRLASRRHKPD